MDTFGALPPAAEMNHKTQLEWEKELMGVYFTPHPLLKLAEAGKKHVGAYVGEITPESDGNDCRDVIHEDALVLTRGKVQVRDDKIVILADLIWNYPIETPKPEGVQKTDRPIPGIFSNTPVIVPPPAPRIADFAAPSMDDLPSPEDWEEEDSAATETTDDAPNAELAAPPLDLTAAENAAPTQAIGNDATEPLLTQDAPDTTAPPQTDAPDAENPYVPPLRLEAQTIPEKKPEPLPAPKAALPEIKLDSGIAIPSKNGGGRAPRGNGASANAARENAAAYQPRTSSNLKVRVRFQRSYDQQLDTKRMRDVVKLLRSADGRDRFALIVPLQASWVELDFPNYYTNFQTVQQQLFDLVDDWGEVEIG
ncbi:MAG: hypothetical protein DCC52_10985 [Chloroflexi bacterium]|nr:MAG: hypothetical protein DCC52_10985 [Chloroflexota bacterium]